MPSLHRIKMVDNTNVKQKRAGNAEEWTALVSYIFFLGCHVTAVYSNLD